MSTELSKTLPLFDEIKNLIDSARQRTAVAVNEEYSSDQNILHALSAKLSWPHLLKLSSGDRLFNQGLSGIHLKQNLFAVTTIRLEAKRENICHGGPDEQARICLTVA